MADTDDDGSTDAEELAPYHPAYCVSSPVAAERALDLSRVPSATGLLPPLPDRFALAADQSFTVEAWIYPMTDGDGIIAQYTTTAGGADRIAFEFGLQGSVPYARIQTAGGTTYGAGGAGVIPALPHGSRF